MTLYDFNTAVTKGLFSSEDECVYEDISYISESRLKSKRGWSLNYQGPEALG